MYFCTLKWGIAIKKKKKLTAEMQPVGTFELENLNYYTLLDNALKTNEYRNWKRPLWVEW